MVFISTSLLLITLTYNVVQPQKTKNGMRYYFYEVTAEWDLEKKRSRQKRRYLGPCDADGNLNKEPTRKQMEILNKLGLPLL